MLGEVDSCCQVCRTRGKQWAKVTGKGDFSFLHLEIKAAGLSGAMQTHPPNYCLVFLEPVKDG